VLLSAEVQAGDAPVLLLRWELGDGSVATGSELRVTLPVGWSQVRAEAVDAAGLVATDRLAIPVGEASAAVDLRATADVQAHEQGAGITLQAQSSAAGAAYASLEWALSSGHKHLLKSGLSLDVGAASTLDVAVRALDERGRELARDHLIVRIPSGDGTLPPLIRSLSGAPVVCSALSYVPVASGTPPFSWSVSSSGPPGAHQVPAGLLLDPTTGALSASPDSACHDWPASVTLTVSNAAGRDLQGVPLRAPAGGGSSPVDAAHAEAGCGCAQAASSGSGAPPPALVLLLAALLLLRRSHRARRPPRRRPRSHALTSVVALLGLGVLGCGDALVQGDYPGEPLLSLQTLFAADSGLYDPAHLASLQLVLVWATAETDCARPLRGHVQPLTLDGQEPGRYLLHRVPGDSALLVHEAGFKLGLARILALAAAPPQLDASDCAWGERCAGGHEEHVVAYRRGEPSQAVRGWLQGFMEGLPPPGLSLLQVLPRSRCPWVDATCAYGCSGDPDLLVPPPDSAQPSGWPLEVTATLHVTARPGRFRVPCF